jgi:hypothetical protein
MTFTIPIYVIIWLAIGLFNYGVMTWLSKARPDISSYIYKPDHWQIKTILTGPLTYGYLIIRLIFSVK